jgi:hypothetical protein
VSGSKHEMARAIRPRRLEGEHEAAIGQQPEPALSHRRAEQIAAEMLPARAVRGRHRDVGVEIEARQMGVPEGRGEHPCCVGIVPHAPHTRARTRTERDSPLNRGAADPGQGRGFFDHGIGPDEVGIAGIEATTFEQMLHPRGNAREHDADFVIRQEWERPEIERVPLVGSVEDASRITTACGCIPESVIIHPWTLRRRRDERTGVSTKPRQDSRGFAALSYRRLS